MGLGEPQLQVVQVAVRTSGGPGAILDGIRGLCLLFAIESLDAVDEGLETQAVLDIVRIAFAAERELHREIAASGPPRSLLGPASRSRFPSSQISEGQGNGRHFVGDLADRVVRHS